MEQLIGLFCHGGLSRGNVETVTVNYCSAPVVARQQQAVSAERSPVSILITAEQRALSCRNHCLRWKNRSRAHTERGFLSHENLIVTSVPLQFVEVEGQITSIVDLFPSVLRKGYRREMFIAVVCSISYLLGLAMVTKVSLSSVA